MSDLPKKMTAPAIKALKGERKITMVTAYDAPGAVIASEAGADVILVGDSVANTMLGFEHTISVDIPIMIHHTAAVARSNPRSLVVGDMPWMSYHVTVEGAVANAARLVREGGAEAVKLEGGRNRVDVVQAILSTEIPVMGHIGLTPQSVYAMGGYKVQGRAAEDARALIADAVALDEAGVFAMVLEGIPDTLAEIITKEVAVPTIGIGAGRGTDGQVLVFHDVLGLHDGHKAKFVRQYADLKAEAVAALQAFFADVQSGDFPSEEETYHMSDETIRALEEDRQRDVSWPMSW